MILIDMNMPQSCQECPAFGTRACNKWDKHKSFSDQRTKRHKDCPLHESDVIEVLQEIRQEIDNIDGYEDRYSSLFDRPSLVKRVRNDCLAIIDKHLEQYKEETE